MNEDSFSATGLCGPSDDGEVLSIEFDEHCVLAVVADGLGGHPDGQLASSIVVSAIVGTKPRSGSELVEALHSANAAVYGEMSQEAGNLGMGSTVAAALITSKEVAVSHVGDSPVFELIEERLTQLTVDDVTGSQTGLPGVPTGALSQALGGSMAFRPVTPSLMLLPREPSARYLLCTDGLSSVLPKHQIAAGLRRSEISAAACALLESVLEAGAPDNATCVLVETE